MLLPHFKKFLKLMLLSEDRITDPWNLPCIIIESWSDTAFHHLEGRYEEFRTCSNSTAPLWGSWPIYVCHPLAKNSLKYSDLDERILNSRRMKRVWIISEWGLMMDWVENKRSKKYLWLSFIKFIVEFLNHNIIDMQYVSSKVIQCNFAYADIIKYLPQV